MRDIEVILFSMFSISIVFGCIPTESPSDEEETSSISSSTTTSTSTSSSTTTTTTSTTTTTTEPYCLPNWVYFDVTDSCYLLEPTFGGNFDDARDYCVNTWGSNLASIHSDAENDFVVGLGPEENEYLVIGLRRTGSCTTCFMNYDGTPFDYTHWVVSQPDDSMGIEDCVGMRLADSPNGLRSQWNDRECVCIGLTGCPPKYLVCKMPRL